MYLDVFKMRFPDILMSWRDWFASVTWLEMRSSHTESAIWMAFGLWVTEIAFILNLSLPYIMLA